MLQELRKVSIELFESPLPPLVLEVGMESVECLSDCEQ